ncbi:hypothetical protein HY449_01360 [Candidatus Pacearchaeota archaeon]|nr:hypothetical protein [Candidatus Pacearchaeota archaeon]
MLFYVLLGISALFFLVLLIKYLTKSKKLCAICSAVFLAWFFLLILFYAGKFSNQIIISILLGMSITGIYYLAEKNAGKKLTVFRLPFISTLIAFGYFLAALDFQFSAIIFILALWLVFFLLYLFRENPGLSSFANKLIECCKKW